jgi:transposase
MIGLGARGRTTERYWWISTGIVLWTCSQAGAWTLSEAGWSCTRALPLSPATDLALTLRPPLWGAPGAQQVADRFHLLLNLSAAVERAFEERSHQLLLPPVFEPKATPESATPDTACKPTAQQLTKLQRRERRLARYQQVIELHQQDHSVNAISRLVCLERKTIRRWIRAGQFPEHKRPVRPRPKVHAFADHLQRRWTEGCRNATKLFQEIRELGYRGGRSMVAQFVSGWRKSGKPVKPHVAQRIAPKHATILVTRTPDQLGSSQQLLLERLAIECPDSIRIRRISLDFREALTSGDSRQLRHRIERVKRSEIGPIIRFAWSLTKDLSAVTAAVDTEWSNGQVEGQVNRLKTLKRQMYGRAGFTLLRARVLPFISATPLSRAP